MAPSAMRPNRRKRDPPPKAQKRHFQICAGYAPHGQVTTGHDDPHKFLTGSLLFIFFGALFTPMRPIYAPNRYTDGRACPRMCPFRTYAPGVCACVFIPQALELHSFHIDMRPASMRLVHKKTISNIFAAKLTGGFWQRAIYVYM